MYRKIMENQAFMIAYTAMMTAVVFISTVVIAIYIPATEGFFNIGEFGVYLAALTGGPIVGAIAGGLGSAFADIFLGFSHYAPITFTVKGLEGLIVGFLAIYLRKIRFSRTVGILASFVAAAASIYIGSSYYVGEAELDIVLNKVTVSIATFIWGVVGVVMLAILTYSTYKRPSLTGDIIAIFIGGFEMMLGYFIAEYVIYGAGAYVELFYNLFQVLIGLGLVMLVYPYLERLLSGYISSP